MLGWSRFSNWMPCRRSWMQCVLRASTSWNSAIAASRQHCTLYVAVHSICCWHSTTVNQSSRTYTTLLITIYAIEAYVTPPDKVRLNTHLEVVHFWLSVALVCFRTWYPFLQLMPKWLDGWSLIMLKRQIHLKIILLDYVHKIQVICCRQKFGNNTCLTYASKYDMAAVNLELNWSLPFWFVVVLDA